MPSFSSEPSFSKFQILNYTVDSFLVLETEKKNHCVFPSVFVSFVSRRLYSSGYTRITVFKLPDSKRDSKRNESVGSVSGTGKSDTNSTAGL
jgi:hypothetical protein